MLKQQISMAVLAASLAVTPVTRAAADAGDVAAGVLLGVIGSAAVNSANKKKTTTKKVYVAPSVSSAQRAENREVQTSLNYFGFPAGTPDGVMGRNSRAAVSQYQAFMGYPPTGQLTAYESQFLTSSYHRAIAGGQATLQLASTNPMGLKGVLKSYQQEMAAPAATMAATGTMAAAPGTMIVVAPQAAAPAATVAAAPAAPVAEAPVEAAALPSFAASSSLPNFMGGSKAVSLASHCNKVSLLTNTNGGFVTEAAMTDANFALNEQFCLARTYAISQGEEMAARIPGFTPDQIAQQCAAFGPALKEQVAALSLKPQAEVMRDVGSFVLQSGMAPAELSGTAKVCLSVGYRTDDMDVALASALLLSVLGEPVYAELLGHHLSQGFGASRRPDLSLAWYQTGLDAITKGAQPVFAPGQPERAGLIRKAAYQVGGAADAAASPALPTVQPAALPTFQVEN
ncbi:peptidoglycan-binding domain-containing protein [Actibacterium sp. D379-3]